MNTTEFDIEIVEVPTEEIEVVDVTVDKNMPEVAFEVVAEDEAPEEIVVDDNEAFEPVVEYGEWKTAEDFHNYIVKSVRSVPPVYEDSKNSLRRAFQHFQNVQKELIDGVEQDAAYADLSEEQLKSLDAVEEGIEQAMDRLAHAVDNGLTKTATKSSGYLYYVNPFIYSVARIMMNAKVSQGKNIEEVFSKLDDKYKLDDREKLELKFILNDMGHPIRSSFVDHEDMMEQYFA